jgi:hypothetical protein
MQPVKKWKQPRKVPLFMIYMGFNKQYETIFRKEESHFLEVKNNAFLLQEIKKTLHFTLLTIVYQQ